MTPPPADAASPLLGGDDTRDRLLQAAVAVFAKHGYHGASTREICEQAGANTAAIHYHFRDKAGLYKALFELPIAEIVETSSPMDQPGLSVHERLVYFYRGALMPLDCDEIVRQLMLLHAREQVEPSGVLGDTHPQAIRPHHDQMMRLLCAELGIAAPDQDLEGLCFAMAGIALVYVMGRDVVDAFAPGLVATPEARETLIQRCAFYGAGLIAAERLRRGQA